MGRISRWNCPAGPFPGRLHTKPLQRYTPDIPAPSSKSTTPLERKSTIRHCYTHTSGLWGHWGDDIHDHEYLVGYYYPLLPVARFPMYNGADNAIGGKIIEQISGLAMPRFYRRHLLEPLGCNHTTVRGTFGDATSTPMDIARIGQMILNGGAYGSQRFLSAKSIEELYPSSLKPILGYQTRARFGIDTMGLSRVIQTGMLSANGYGYEGDWRYDFGLGEQGPQRPGTHLYGLTKHLGLETATAFADRHGLDIMTLLFHRLRPHDQLDNRDGNIMIPYATAWDDLGPLLLAALQAPEMPNPNELFYVTADMPMGKFHAEKALRLLGWQAGHRFERFYSRKV